jgi:hypothetical protein
MGVGASFALIGIGGSRMTREEKILYQQIHLPKLLIDWTAGFALSSYCGGTVGVRRCSSRSPRRSSPPS